MGRVMADCRRFESDTNCSLTVIGEEEEVVRVATKHAIADHGHEDTPELWEMTRQMLEPADAYAEQRIPQPFPG